MNYEEKYNNAIESIKRIYDQADSYGRELMEKEFPELRESEDEMIRKAIVKMISDIDGGFPFEKHGIIKKKALAWLGKQGEKHLFNFDEAEKEKNDFVSSQFIECRKSFNEFKELDSYWFEYVGDDTYIGRSDNILNQRFHITPRQLFTLFTHEHCPKDNEVQCEQKSADKVEPKFKNGQWIVWQDKCYKVNYNGCGYELVDQNGLSTSLEYGTIDENAHLWTIQDAKDGDVLATKKGNSFIYDKDRYNNGLAYYYAGLDVNKELTLKSPHHMLAHFGELHSVSPATKEQRDLLFQKMKESGYKWDAENKKLNKIEQESTWNEKIKGLNELGTLEMPIDVTEPYYIKGKQDALKDLPKWKKATEHKEFAVHVCVMDEDMYPYLDTEVNEGEHYIELSDLKTLPKEE